jgi:hypothetical protein
MDIINDASSQTVITTLPTITGTYNPLISQTDLNTALATKQNTLTAATNLLGIGSSITALDWDKITLNKPSTFPPTMTSIYSKTETDGLLNAKQATLTFQSPLINTANTISLSTTNLITTTGGQTINGTLTTTDYLYTQNIQPINTGLAQNLNLTQRLTGNINFNCEGAGTINCIINGVNRFYVNSAGNAVLAGNLYEGGQLLSGKYQAKLTASTALLGIGSAITEINYNNITTNKPDLTIYALNSSLSSYLTISSASSTYQPTLSFTSPMTKTGNNVSIDLSSYATTTALAAKENALTFSSPLTRTTNTIGINLSGYATTANLASYLPLAGGQMTGNIGFGIAPSSTILINCSNASSTAFQNIQMMNNIGEFFYFGIAGNAAGNSNYINNFFIQASKGLVFNSMNKTHTGIPDMIINNTSVGINTTAPNTTYKLDVNGNINGLILYEGGVTLASKYTTSASLTNYVLKAGDTMSGALTVNGNINITGSGTNNLIFDNAYNLKKIQLNNNAGIGAGNVDLTFYSAGTFTFRNTALSTTLFSIDDSGSLSFNGRLFPGKGLYTDNVLISTSNIIASNFIEGGVALASKYITSASLDTTYLRLNGANSMTGNLGIGTASPTISSLSIYTGTTSTILSLVIRAANPANQASIIFYNNLNAAGSIGLGGSSVGAYYSSNLFLTSPKDINFFVNAGSIPSMCILANGNTGIGTINPTSKLCINPNPVYGGVFNFAACPCIITNPTPSGTSILNDPQPVLHLCREGTLLQSYGQRISFYLSRYENNALNSRTRCDIVLAEAEFLNKTVMTLFSSGNVNISNSLSINGSLVNDFCFNNLGFNHADITDFNAPVGFGCRFIFGNTNGPSVNYGAQTSSYSLFMGLGINYPASGPGSYGCQLALQRSVTNPTLSVRYKENNSWGGWSGITADVARTLNGTATFTVNVWHKSSDNQQRLYFENNTTTYIQGQGTNPIVFRNNANSDIAVIDSNGKMTLKTINISGFDGITLRIDGANNYWNIFTGTTPTTLKTNSLIFFHGASGIASNWWLDGTQTNTNADISDKRSKYNIQDFSALETIEKLKPKSFDVIDDKDVKFQYGFIAQDIEEIPEVAKLVFTEPDYIANINTYGKRTNDDGCCIITANDDLTDKIEIGDEIKFVSDNKDKDNQEFILDATPYHNRYKRRYAKVTEIISPTEFKVDCEINNLCCLDDDEFLIYGKKVEDAKSLDYNSFIALNTKAIQELYKIIQQQQEQLNELRNLINPKY